VEVSLVVRNSTSFASAPTSIIRCDRQRCKQKGGQRRDMDSDTKDTTSPTRPLIVLCMSEGRARKMGGPARGEVSKGAVSAPSPPPKKDAVREVIERVPSPSTSSRLSRPGVETSRKTAKFSHPRHIRQIGRLASRSCNHTGLMQLPERGRRYLASLVQDHSSSPQPCLPQTNRNVFLNR
jgi:hypothetical protein